MQSLVTFGSAFLLSNLLVMLLKPIALKVGLVDNPGGRKQHKIATPTHGGIAIFCAFLITTLLLTVTDSTITSLLIACGFIVALGAVDDIKEIRPKDRILLQTATALFVILFTDTQIKTLGSFFGSTPLDLGLLSIPFTVFCFVAGVNAINMTDGIDGLAGGQALITCLALAYLFNQAGNPELAQVSLIVGGAVLGFLVFNYRFKKNQRAKLFMGDSGSTFLGFALVWLLINCTQQMANNHSSPMDIPALALWLLAIPLIDSGTVILKRIKRGVSPMSAGRDHLHHLLLDRGHSIRHTCARIHLASLAIITAGISLCTLPYANSLLIITFALGLITYYKVTTKLDENANQAQEPSPITASKNVIDSASPTLPLPVLVTTPAESKHKREAA